ncbi:hypothetical protein GEV33_009190 [Tenebrio molitor]|uniref:Uncharacterized protein n=1 Tax=Tenebrio molitor TaxID=7067 RepID=A0A8J6HFC2_TENMO|nr:hypothetical protein GEV33_009190 [Tenebrio molitor]
MHLRSLEPVDTIEDLKGRIREEWERIIPYTLNGLSDPDFRYRPRKFGERRGKYIKVEQTPCQGFSTSSGQRLRPIRVKNSNRNVAADKGFLHEGQRPYASADNFTTLLDRRHPPGPLRRAGPHTGLSLAEEPESRSNSYLARECCGEEGPRGLSEDTDGVINQRRKKDSEDLPPARSPKDSYWISSPRPGPLLSEDNNLQPLVSWSDAMTMKCQFIMSSTTVQQYNVTFEEKINFGGLNKKDRLVNVLFDEINVSEEIHYDNHLDEFKGLADDGKTRTDENAKSQGGLKLPAAQYLALTDTLYTALNNVRAYLFRFSANSLPQIVLDCLVY